MRLFQTCTSFFINWSIIAKSGSVFLKFVFLKFQNLLCCLRPWDHGHRRFSISHGLWKRKLLAKKFAHPVWNCCKENPFPCHRSLTKGLCPVLMNSTINKVITKPFLSFQVFVDENLYFEDEEIQLMNRSCKRLTKKLTSLYASSFEAFLLLHDSQSGP